MFNNENDKQNEQDMIDESIAVLDSMEHPFHAQRKLIKALLINAGLFLAYFPASKLLPFDVFDSIANGAILLFVLTLFGIGFLIGYASFKLFQIRYSAKADVNIETGLMSGFSHSEKGGRKLQLYFFASFCGVLNIGIFLILSKFV